MLLSSPKIVPLLLVVGTISVFHTQALIHECLNTQECGRVQRCIVQRGFRVDDDCGEDACDEGPNKCAPKLGALKKCSRRGNDCRSGLYCAFDVKGQRSLPVCAPKKKLNEPCAPTDTRPCANDSSVHCNTVTKRCERWTGRLNDPCRWYYDCRHQEGFYCDSNQRKCVRRKLAGAECRSQNYECAGFCVKRKTPKGERGVCMTSVPEGGACRGDASCAGYQIRRSDIDDVRCNSIGSESGFCVRKSKKLREPGDICDPNNDRCDRARLLFCKKVGNAFKCLQRATLGRFCTPGSKYSSCDERETGEPLECRRPLSFTKKQPFRVPSCQRSTQTVKRGEICNIKEFSRCERSTNCLAVAGIEKKEDEVPTVILGYCVKVVQAGKECKNRFRTGCAKGSYCIEGICRKRKEAPKTFVNYAGDDVFCVRGNNKKQCAHGLKCQKSGRRSYCVAKSIVVQPGMACYAHPNKKRVCAPGYVCIRDLKTDGYKRCLKQGQLHDYCEFRTCSKGLECRAGSENGPVTERTCYNPKTALHAGAKCTIATKNRSHNCGMMKIGFSDRPLKCIPVPGKGAIRKCLLENKLFDYCNESENIVCAPGLSCNTFQVCVK